MKLNSAIHHLKVNETLIDQPKLNHNLTSKAKGSHDIGTSAPPGKPGRPTKTLDLAKFANIRRKRKKQMPWSEIAVEWKFKHPDDNRVSDEKAIREAWRRHFGDKAAKR